MKTLILNGSPHKKGDTAFLLNSLIERLEGEKTIVNAYDSIAPCTDCRLCNRCDRCSIEDEMSKIMYNIDEYDSVIVATPLYYNQPTGALLSLMSRFQYVFAQQFFRNERSTPHKKAIVIVVGGGQTIVNSSDAEKTIRIALHSINTEVVAYVRSLHTDKTPAQMDSEAITQIDNALELLKL